MLRYLFATAIASLSLQAFAWQVDLTAAEKKFQAREDNEANIEDARKIFVDALPNLKIEQKVYAIDRIGRLAGYQGVYHIDDNHKKVEEVADQCMSLVEEISPKVMGTSRPEYYYWKAICWGLKAQVRAKKNDIMFVLKNSAAFKTLLEDGLKLSATYEGGGFYRLLGIMYVELPPINPMGPSRDLSLSLKMLDNAIKSPAYENAENPDTATGNYFYPVFLYKARAYEVAGDTQSAIRQLNDAIKRIKASNVSEDQIPESHLALKMMEKRKSELEGK